MSKRSAQCKREHAEKIEKKKREQEQERIEKAAYHQKRLESQSTGNNNTDSSPQLTKKEEKKLQKAAKKTNKLAAKKALALLEAETLAKRAKNAAAIKDTSKDINAKDDNNEQASLDEKTTLATRIEKEKEENTQINTSNSSENVHQMSSTSEENSREMEKNNVSSKAAAARLVNTSSQNTFDACQGFNSGFGTFVCLCT